MFTHIFTYWGGVIQHAGDGGRRNTGSSCHLNETGVSLFGAHSHVFLTVLLKFAQVFMKQYTCFQKKVNNFVMDVTMKKLHFGIVGVGNIAPLHALAIQTLPEAESER
jgi:hypothetical protein